MKDPIKKWFKRLILLILIPFILSIQNRGEFSFQSPNASNIKNMNTMAFGSTSSAFVSKIGGVSFDQIAKPEKNLNIKSLKINYNAENEDGKRLELVINNQKINADLYDWLLIPIAKYSASQYYSCFTLFGQLENKNLEKIVLDNQGRVMNYHPDFQNTLLGLRLADLDALIVYNFTSDLPKESYGYILGKGESAPDIRANQLAMNEVYYLVNGIQGKYQKTHRSYVISDFTREIEFNIQNNALNISGSPYYFCWRFKQDQPGYDINAFNNKLIESYQQLIDQNRKSNPGFDVQAFLIDSLLQTAKRYEGRYNLYESGTFNDFMDIKTGDEDRKAFIRRYDINSIYNMILQTESYMDAQSVDYLKEYSDELSSNTEKLRAVNPAVWDAATATMRYAAFFRYIKANFPTEWKTFMDKIVKVKIEPEVITPTVMYPTNNQAVEKALKDNKKR